MNFKFVKSRWFWLALTALSIGLVVLLRFSDVCALRQVSLDNMPVLEWQEAYGLDAKRHLFDQPFDSVARDLLKEPNVLRVDVDYEFPDRVNIRTNDFTVVAFVVNGKTGRVHGLNGNGRVVPIRSDHEDWEHPVFSGIANAPLYDFCSDVRVRETVTQLQVLYDSNIDLYRLIAEVGFQESDYLTVAISGASYPLRVTAGQLAEQLSEFALFLEQYDADTDDAKVFDLRYDGMIVKKGRRQ